MVQYWNGTAFVSGTSPLVGAMTYKGTTASLTVAPATTVDGDTYYYSGVAGTLTWAGITFNPSGDVQPGDISNSKRCYKLGCGSGQYSTSNGNSTRNS